MFDLTGGSPAAAGQFAEATRLLGHDPRGWVGSAGIEELRANRSLAGVRNWLATQEGRNQA